MSIKSTRMSAKSVTGECPSIRDDHALLLTTASVDRPVTGTLRRQYGGEIVDLIDKMWDQNPKDRPSMTEVCTSLEELVELKKQAG